MTYSERLFSFGSLTFGWTHDLVYDCCRQCLEGEQNFVETLMNAPEIANALTRDAVEALVDPSNYLGVAPEMVERFLSNRAR